jgi:uncharacterized Fe-S cluster protein YjdI
MNEFRNDRIAVRFDESLCCHAGECVKGLPAVFDPSKEPWIDVNAAPPEAIAEVVARCPSGALSCEPSK